MVEAATIILLIILALYLYKKWYVQPAQALVNDIKTMAAACEELQQVDSNAAESCKMLTRGLKASIINQNNPNAEESRRLYLALASPTALSAAAQAYLMAAEQTKSENAELAKALKHCGESLRKIVKSIHRLGHALDLEWGGSV